MAVGYTLAQQAHRAQLTDGGSKGQKGSNKSRHCHLVDCLTETFVFIFGIIVPKIEPAKRSRAGTQP